MTYQVRLKIQDFLTQFPLEKYEKDEVVFHAGSKDDFLYFIEAGAVKMTTISSKGQNLVLHIFYPNSCFSLLALINEGVNKYDFRTVLSTSVRKVQKDKFLIFLQENADVLFDFQLRLLRGLQGLLNRIEQSTFVPAYNQVAGVLLYFARHFGGEHSAEQPMQKKIELRLTHQEIADWLGLSRENVSIQLKQLERDNLIEVNEHLFVITNLPELQKIADPYTML